MTAATLTNQATALFPAPTVELNNGAIAINEDETLAAQRTARD